MMWLKPPFFGGGGFSQNEKIRSRALSTSRPIQLWRAQDPIEN